MEQNQDFWRKCSTCKKPIGFGAKYYVCSVSTCNGQRTGYVFCGMSCFDAHLPGARHRDAGAVEMKAGLQPWSPPGEAAPTRAPERRIAAQQPPVKTYASENKQNTIPREVLIVASRLKEYIDARSGGYNTSASVMDVLSDYVRILCDRAIDQARADGRRTVMDRDFEFLKK